MGVTHEPWLVVLSLIVAMQGAYVGLRLAEQLGASAGMHRRLLLAAAAISLAVAIWSMHFVAMLAARLPFPIDYLVFPTLLSFLVCVIVVGVGVFAATAGPPRATRLAAAAAFMGGGIASMHYIGMAALHDSAHMTHAPAYVVASVLVGITASGLALWLPAQHGGRWPLLRSAVAFGMAIAGMHFTAMAGLTLQPFDEARAASAPALSTDLLAIVVAVVAFLLSGLFLLALVPDRGPSAGRALLVSDLSSGGSGLDAGQAQLLDAVSAAAVPAGVPLRPPARTLPVERDGTTHQLPVEDIVAVHANAHYTFLFDGTARLFCPLAIGDVEARLDTSRFARVHRSHIVALDRVVGLRRAGDHGVIELAASERYVVPVSRSRLAVLRARLGKEVSAARRPPIPPRSAELLQRSMTS
jgi:NO-binding membrane sensor protein with MHYT domain